MEQPDMCKFLVENGADIDEVATSWGDPAFQWYVTWNGSCRTTLAFNILWIRAFEANYRHMNSVPLTHEVNGWEMDENQMQRAEECRRLLLDAGADPTLSGSDEEYLLEVVVLGGALVSVDKLWSYFILLTPSGHNEVRAKYR
jgi:hypothetical protein